MFKRHLTLMVLGIVTFSWLVAGVDVYAASFGDVVINEIAWAGTSDNSNDEWIELYNPGNEAVDLNGWYIEDDGNPLSAFKNVQIAAHGYFLIEDAEEAVSGVNADAVIALSLANAGDTLLLKDANGKLIDKVNEGGGAWYAGNGTDKSSMEKIDPENLNDIGENWASAGSGNGAKGRNGSAILGTPKSTNSNFGGEGAKVYFKPAEIFANEEELIKIPIYVDDVSDLYAYGFEISYSPSLLTFVSAEEADFLKSDGVNTAFNAGLKNGKEGSLILGNARLSNPAKGLDGSGKLFEITFKVVSPESHNEDINFATSSFLSDSKGNIPVKFGHADLHVNEEIDGADVISSLEIVPGEKRYSLKLSWQDNPDGADSYVVKRKSPKGEFVKLAEMVNPFFVDEDSLSQGGQIIPELNYIYQVIAVKNGIQSAPVEITGSDARGLKGDNNRSDLVDGGDIENLARSYGSEYGDEEYEALTDTNYDGVVNGNDLIDIGVNFALSY